MQKLLLILLTLIFSACSSNEPASDEKLKQEVNGVIYEKMLLAEAQNALSHHAFNCHEGTAYDPNLKDQFECTRIKGGVLYSCIHRVSFEVSPVSHNITNIVIHKPMCAGL